MLEITALSKTYSNGECALSDISFSLAKGEILAVIGHSGAGKSTLLRCINRMEECEGEIKMEGISITKAKKGELRRLRCNIAMMHQNYNLVESLSVIENVLHGQIGRIGFLRGLFGIYTNEEKKKALAIIEEVGLTEFAFRTCLTLSGGQKHCNKRISFDSNQKISAQQRSISYCQSSSNRTCQAFCRPHYRAKKRAHRV